MPRTLWRRLLLRSTMQFVDQYLTSVIRRWRLSWLTSGALLLFAASSSPATANVTIVEEDFRDTTSYGWTIGGTFRPCLTAAGTSPLGSIPNCGTTSDAPGTGTLRLTNTQQDIRSFVFYDYAIPANQGLVITFDYFAYGGGGAGPGSGADGTSFFLFDGNTTAPVFGSEGGALGYAQRLGVSGTSPGLTNAYLGVGLDEFGNFANDYEGRGNECPPQSQSPFGGGLGLSPPEAQIKDSVTVRGPGSGLTGYCFLGNSGNLATIPGGFSLDNPTATSRTAPDTRRRVRVTLNTNNTITLEIDPTGTGTAYQTILNSFPAPANRPDSFKFGFASSTGEGINFHELINVRVETIATPPLPDLAITKTHTGNFVPGGTGTYTLRVQNLPTATGPTYGTVTITDTLPEGFSFVSATGTSWNCSAVGQEVTCVYNGPAVNPGGSLPDLSLNVNVTSAPGSYVNQAQVLTQGDSDLTNNTVQDPTLVVGPVVANKTVTDLNGLNNGNAQPDDILQYTITISNNTPNPAIDVNFQDAIPANTTYVPGSTQLNGTAVPDVGGTMPFVNPTAVNSPDTATSGQISANNAATVTFQVRINNPLPNGVTQVVNQGTVSGNGFPPTPTDDLTTPVLSDATIVPVVPLQPNLRLVKRLTNVTKGGVPLTGINFNSFVDDPTDQNDNAPGWSQLPPVGVYQLGADNPLQSNDEVEYTIYFLSDGSSPANNINFCDLIPEGTTFIPGSIQAITGQTSIDGNFFSPLAPLPTGNACPSQTNPDGAVIVNLGNISNVEGTNFGFIRFRVKIN
ncbi:MAG: hypothetical protein M3O33_18520 [Cyanobacteriota bacterium]|nr:hypothetical protein [Cyanobacteriota bacterium]